MKLYNFYIKYRLVIGIVTMALAIIANILWGFWPSLTLYLIAVLSIFTHFFIGPLRVIQEYLEEGNIAMTKQDFDSAEKHMRKSLDLGLPMKEAEGANKLQLGMMAMQKGNMKEGESLIRQALKSGIPDKESAAMANLQMCQIMMQKREFRAAKDFFKRAKAQKPTTAQVVDQIKQIEKYISRMPG
jgi:uncharacterized protein HemY